MQAPAALAVKQWHTIFTRGGAIGRPLAIVSAIATGYLAYKRMLSKHKLCTGELLSHTPIEDPKSTPFRLNVAATILLPSIVPFTLLVLGPTNNKLIAKKDEFAAAHAKGKAIKANTADGETVHELMDKWATLNMARAVLVAAGALCTVIAAVNKREVAKLGSMSMASRLGW